MKREDLDAVLQELQPVLGGRIQRADVLSERTVVLEARIPGRTVRILICGIPGAARIHAVSARPARLMEAPKLQRTLRERLVGRPLANLHSPAPRTVAVATMGRQATFHLDGRERWVQWQTIPDAPVPEAGVLPEHLETSERIASEQQAASPTAEADLLRARHSKRIRKSLKQQRRLEAKIEGDVARLEVAREQGRLGELLKSQLHLVERGAEKVRVRDWEHARDVDISLDPALSPKRNLERIFHRSKKATRGLPIARRRLESVRSRRVALDAELARLDGLSLELLRAELPGEAQPEPGRAPQTRSSFTHRRFTSLDGTDLWAGRNAIDNDRLLRRARGHDVWLHARGSAGSHVVIRLEKGRAPTQDTLLDAAHLAAFYSAARGEKRLEISYVEARYVRKQKGDPAGLVRLSRARTITLELEPARLARLLGRPVDGLAS